MTNFPSACFDEHAWNFNPSLQQIMCAVLYTLHCFNFLFWFTLTELSQ